MEARFIPSAAQLILLSAIGQHIVVTINSLATGDVEMDLATSIDLIHLSRQGFIRYSIGDELLHCTPTGRRWLHGHQNCHAENRRYGSGH